MEVTNLKQLFHLMHVCGYLPPLELYNQTCWKTRINQYYRIFNHTLTTLSLISFILNFCVNTIKDLTLFCITGLYLTIIAMNSTAVGFVNATMKDIRQILSGFERIESAHAENKAVSYVKRLERKYLQAALVAVSALLTFIVFVYPSLPKSEKDLETLGKLYNLKYPQNSFFVQWYSPYLDLSEPNIFYPCLAVYSYFMFLQILGIVMLISYVPLCVFHLRCNFAILSHFAHLIGKTHLNSLGQPIFYTNLLKNKSVLRQLNPDREVFSTNGTRQSHSGNTNSDEKEKEQVYSQSRYEETRIRRLFNKNPDLYDMFYMRQIIIFQQDIDHQRKVFDTYSKQLMPLFVFTFAIQCPMIFFGIFSPILTTTSRVIMILSASVVFGFMFVNFYCGELLSGTNELLASGLWSSQWYTCSIKTQRDMIVFLRINQRLKYFMVLHWRMGYDWMIGALKFAYSVFNLMQARKSTKQL